MINISPFFLSRNSFFEKKVLTFLYCLQFFKPLKFGSHFGDFVTLTLSFSHLLRVFIPVDWISTVVIMLQQNDVENHNLSSPLRVQNLWQFCVTKRNNKSKNDDNTNSKKQINENFISLKILRVTNFFNYLIFNV